jgi:hypothetical protein
MKNQKKSSLTYEEAEQLCLTVRWKVLPCFQGESCWCRTIGPEIPIFDKEGNEIYIAGSGAIHKEFAEHIVKVHNDSLIKK